MRRLYFTLSKAQRLICQKYEKSKLTDNQLHKKLVMLRDFCRYLDSPEIYMDILWNGGYYGILVDPSASGLYPVDMWLHHNIQYALDEAIKEKKRRMGSSQLELF